MTAQCYNSLSSSFSNEGHKEAMCPPWLVDSVCSSPLPAGFGRRGAGDTPLVTAPLAEPLLCAELDFAVQLGAGLLAMNEVAEATTDTALATVQSAARFSEVGDGRQFAVDGSAGVPAAVEGVAGGLGAVFVLESGVDVADEILNEEKRKTRQLSVFETQWRRERWVEGGCEWLTVIVVVTHDDLLNLAKLAHLAPKVLVEGVEVILQLGGVHLALGVVGRVLVQVRQQDGLRVRGLDVLARAAVAVSAGADFVVEGAIDLVLLGSEDGGQVVRHGGRCAMWTGLLLCGRRRETAVTAVMDGALGRFVAERMWIDGRGNRQMRWMSVMDG